MWPLRMGKLATFLTVLVGYFLTVVLSMTWPYSDEKGDGEQAIVVLVLVGILTIISVVGMGQLFKLVRE